MVSSEGGTKKTEEGPKRRYQRYMYTFWGGGFKGHFSKQNVLFCGLELVQGGREGEGEGEGAGGRAGTEASVFLSQAVWLCSPWWRVFGLLSHLY